MRKITAEQLTRLDNILKCRMMKEIIKGNVKYVEFNQLDKRQIDRLTNGGVEMLNKLAKEIHQNAVEHGWWDEERHFGSLIALMHAELSEALEEYRNKRNPAEIYYSWENSETDEPKPEGIAIELADCIIRILDYCGKAGIDIEEAIRIKHEYNKTRPYRHGGKRI